ncbi:MULTISPECIES: dTDP-4-dehydrorhamnose 3,5-epimerase family protein [Curtobacterium]|uniref:dTDP-4-dehydrorhamnose 3,5-epimerase family protein n=1 Tax=Curtobacterium TaxID=2034 RepID=UPI000480617D|nr:MULTISPECIES: dTDP-4-dehydrorhamnose 3,5-epimerase [Curtobacterium]NQX24401.1 dTDP-4-dehydrorhamnose 3,5-epimerase family protein [Curtobacterium sp. VKM Ac-2852]MBT1605211.1 dTDP-4-dehydrorhamnose 3,5-epimerase family protein [Curtobacterium flaccumfaciens pv. betae]MBT1630601.1 dTDP-4-dehydrorhamnose 3,5-epimerase family protein [Curtobacterium flaccumfaciens pv. oortii]MBT1655685.1 dTDP-4-dehydrorhamnose 3,5-epimerase family protein [Curtobacterium flaccumfaciens pv. betae]MCE0458259.1 d
MQIRELKIPGAWEFTPVQHGDARGAFLEAYRADVLEETVGHPLDLRQVNMSISSAGVARGIHYALVAPSQAKYVTAVRGAFIDYIVDIRVGSPTFGQWDSVRIDDVDRRAVYLSEGLGHAIVALEDQSTVNYLVSAHYDPEREKGITILDPTVGLELPDGLGEPVLSEKDTSAPTLEEAAAAGLLPTYEECVAYTESLRTTK